MSGYVDEGKIRKAYDFLDGYREDEMKELREKIKKTRDEGEKEGLKRTLESMESRKKAQMRKDKAQEVLDRHRKEEKELVKQGKKPFYLKKQELGKRVLVEQYKGMKGKQLDHVIERRRKKVEGKEKKKMPWARREAGNQSL
jgi:ribosomal RNA-processing protein 36